MFERRNGVVIKVIVVISAAIACATCTNPFMRTTTRAKQQCDVMDIETQTVSLTDGQKRIKLNKDPSEKSVLIIPKDALPVGTSREFTISPIEVDGKPGAGVKIVANDGNPTEFNDVVELQLDYTGCSFQNERKLIILKSKDDGSDSVPIGGAASANKKHIRVFIDSFSEFAIAI